MYRALDDGVEMRFVNVAHGDSQEALNQAQAAPEFQESVRRMTNDPELRVLPRPATYSVAQHVDPSR